MTETKKSYPLFGSTVEIVLFDVEDDIAGPLLDEAYALGVRLQKIFNIYDRESEISLLNRKRKLKASKELVSVLRAALGFCKLSGGEYDITRGKQFLQRKRGETVTPVRSSYDDVRITGEMVELTDDDAWLDLGSIAKGYIAERMARYLRKQGAESGYVDARGDIRLFGGETAVGVKHPRKEGIICSIKVAGKGVATSGDYNQYHGTYDQSHILNKKDIIAATVVADDLTEADAYATMLMVCDEETRERVAAVMGEAGIKAMTIDKSLRIHHYNGFEKLVA